MNEVQSTNEPLNTVGCIVRSLTVSIIDACDEWEELTSLEECKEMMFSIALKCITSIFKLQALIIFLMREQSSMRASCISENVSMKSFGLARRVTTWQVDWLVELNELMLWLIPSTDDLTDARLLMCLRNSEDMLVALMRSITMNEK